MIFCMGFVRISIYQDDLADGLCTSLDIPDDLLYGICTNLDIPDDLLYGICTSLGIPVRSNGVLPGMCQS